MARKWQGKLSVGRKLLPALFASYSYLGRAAPKLLIASVCKQAYRHLHAC